MDEDDVKVLAARMRLVESEVPSSFPWREALVKTVLGWLMVLFLSALLGVPTLGYGFTDEGWWFGWIVVYAATTLLLVFLTQAGRAYQAGRDRRAAIYARFGERNRDNSWPSLD